MCGLIGALSWNDFLGETVTRKENALKALNLIESRGPDAKEIWQDGHADLGHVRLAIIDLSLLAGQPMVSACSRYVIVFNGEVYNFLDIKNEIGSEYEWKTDSDTEVILAAFIKFGVDCLQKFHGMFAFAIWDKVDKKLFVARDRMGVKPLYFHASEQLFIFASRPRAIFQLVPNLSKEIDRQGLRYYLESGYLPAPHSYYAAIKKLEPAHYMWVDEFGAETFCYWSLNNIPTELTTDDKHESELLDELDALINKSVQLRMVSNVPVGAFLSGGIDSSLVVAYMKKNANSPVKTFTIGFDDEHFDESNDAELVANHLGTEHVCKRLTPNDLLALMPKYLQEFDEPFFDYSAFPVMAVSQLARNDVTVSLSGDGGDEAFGGYHYYRIIKILSRIQRWPQSIRKALAAGFALIPANKAKLFARALKSNGDVDSFAFIRSVIKDFSGIMQPQFRAETKSFSSLLEAKAQSMHEDVGIVEKSMRLDMAYTLPDDYLQKVDVASMAFSLEAREPLLDHTILEWAAKLPLKWKIRKNVNKYLLRQLAYRHVPRKILDRPKKGFGVPMASWLRNELRPWAESLLADKATMDYLGLDSQYIANIWEKHKAGKWQAQSCLWTILILLQFHQTEHNEHIN